MSPGRRPGFLESPRIPLFSRTGEETLLPNPGNEVADLVVANDDVGILLAAPGMMAVKIKRLLAKRTHDTLMRHSDPEPVPDRGTKDCRGHDAIRTIDPRRDSRHPSPRVLCRQPPAA